LKTLLFILLYILISTSFISAQEIHKCSSYYYSIASEQYKAGNASAALKNFAKQKYFYPGCPDSEKALYNTIKIYHEMIVVTARIEHFDDFRSYIIEFSSLSDDSVMTADVAAWWTEVKRIEKETTLTTPVFWEMVGFIALFVIYFTISAN